MKFTLSWLKRFLKTDANLDIILNTLNSIGFEVEDVIDRRDELAPFQVAEIIDTTAHPNADKLRVCNVLSSEGLLQIVCGAPNARAGIKVILAKVGVLIPNGKFQIKSSEIRGVLSNGMLCSETELMVGTDEGGIVELPSDAIVGESFAKYYGLDDPVIEISVTPNRGDCLGVYYIAKELAAKGLGELIELIPQCDTYSTFATLNIKNIINKPSPNWLKLLLKNIGQTSISAVVDITNYMCISFARPMHAYDSDKLDGKLKVEYAKDKERFIALNNKEYELSAKDLVVRDNNGAQSLFGVIGGKASACEADTKNITLECAISTPDSVSQSGRRHKIDTDSRHRFERGVDPAMVLPGLNMAASMIIEICGGKASVIESADSLPIKKKEIIFDIKEFTRVIGLNLNTETMVDILRNLAFDVDNQGSKLIIKVPTFRHDINIQEDIVEEIIRIHGYDNIPVIPIADNHISRVLTNLQRRSMEAQRILAARGYDEIITWSFMDVKDAQKFYDVKEELVLLNPISQELGYMRPSILPNILSTIAKNTSRSLNDLAFFEVGPVFGNSETINVVGARVGCLCDKSPHAKGRRVDVYDIKSDLELLLGEMGFKFDKLNIGAAPSYYHPYRSGSLSLGKNIIGVFGEVHPEILEHYGIKDSVSAFEINLNAIPESKLKYGHKGSYKISDYQAVSRDFAFVVDVDQSAGAMLSSIQNIDKKLIKKVSLFDVYIGDKLSNDKKSLAFNVILQADDRTLVDEDINNLCKQIIDSICSKYDAVLRS